MVVLVACTLAALQPAASWRATWSCCYGQAAANTKLLLIFKLLLLSSCFYCQAPGELLTCSPVLPVDLRELHKLHWDAAREAGRVIFESSKQAKQSS